MSIPPNPGAAAQPNENLAPVVLVTGLSGAGKSTALKALEDLGYEAVDNLPLSLLEPLLVPDVHSRLALGIDIRTRAFSPQRVLDAQTRSAASGRAIRVIFLDCATTELIRRFSETRRRHPLALDRPVKDGIQLERELFSDLRRSADMVIDTTDLSSNDLRYAIISRFGSGTGKSVTLTLMSFGYARGIPRDADLVFDVRFLKNPHWEPELRPKTGVDADVRAYVESDPAYAPAFQAILQLLTLLFPGYAREGRAYLMVAFGCTGGKHRSVAMAQAMAEALTEAGWPPNAVIHRDRLSGRDGRQKEPQTDGEDPAARDWKGLQ